MLARNSIFGSKAIIHPVFAAAGLRDFSNRTGFNKMAIPLQKLKFIQHPRYGPVYPVCCIDRKHEYPNLARFSLGFLSLTNFMTIYSTFFVPIFTAEFSAIIANPAVFIPSLCLNYYMYKRHFPLFYMDRSIITNIFLMPSGTKFVVETRDGTSREIEINDVFLTKHLRSRYEYRIEF